MMVRVHQRKNPSRKRALSRVTAVVGLGVLAWSCGSSTSSEGADAPPATTTRLRTCGILTAGQTFMSPPTSGFQRCWDACQAQASCSELAALWCRQSISQSLTQCRSDCETAMWRCLDGTMIRLSSQCDQKPDCPDGSDEQNCAVFTCADGSKIPIALRCDGNKQCSDGSDELDCPTFQCANGKVLPGWARCNVIVECNPATDFSDEAGCATLICPSSP